MDRARGLPADVLRWDVWRSPLGFYSKSFRFEGWRERVLGLNRTGKSCRLRWVNYLHPGLKRGKMTPQEEKLVIELHGKWGNRWSRIARKLPGRTDNEIKNYWRTHMRKQAQERKRSKSPLSSSSKCGSSPSSTITTDSASPEESGKESVYNTGGNPETTVMEKVNDGEGQSEKAYSLDDIWDEIALSETNLISPVCGGLTEEGCRFSCPLVGSLAPHYNDSLWQIAEEESKLLLPSSDQLFPMVESDGAYNTDYSHDSFFETCRDITTEVSNLH